MRVPGVVLALAVLAAGALAAAPQVDRVPVPPIRTALGVVPGVAALQVRAALPDVMVMNDGTRVTTPKQWQAWLGAMPAYALLGQTARLGVNYANHRHALTDDDWTALLDFADVHLRGHRVDRRFDVFPD